MDIYFGRRLVLTPTTGIGAYKTRQRAGPGRRPRISQRRGNWPGASDDLSRLGVGLHYLSNYGLGDIDPGIGIATVFYAYPLGAILPP